MKNPQQLDMKPEQSLSQKVIKGSFWIFALRISRRALDFVRTVILARLLAPHDFGLMGIALLTLQTLEAFSQTGFQSALVQRKGDISKYLNVAWTILVLRGIVLSTVIFFSAPFIAKFFSTSESKSLIRVVGLSFLIQGFTNIAVVLFQKELNFKKQYLFEVSGFAFDFLVSIFLVFILKNVWALVIGKITGETTRLIASYILDRHRPCLTFHFKHAKELHEFGRWIS